MDNALIRTLRERRVALRLSKQAVARKASMNRATFEKWENNGRCAALEQFERWAAALDYCVTLVPICEEEIIWS